MTTSDRPVRRAEIRRTTRETEIRLTLDLDGSGKVSTTTGIGFFDHMLDALGTHGRLDLEVKAQGDLHVDQHHLVEDVGIVLGQALRQALGENLLIERFAHAFAPLDEALARAVVDISGRSFLHFGAEFSRSEVGGFDTELVREFFQAFASNARINLHLDLLRGKNAHHQIEALFKATALALRQALRPQSGATRLPSTKGTIA